MKSTNKKQFLALIKRYREIKLEDIKPGINQCIDGEAKRLTGFGSVIHCTLCQNCYSCEECYTYIKGKQDCILHDTYKDIRKAKTPEKLIEAFKARANYLEFLIK